MELGAAFGRVLRRLRFEQKLSQGELGTRVSLQAKTISSLEMGRHVPSIDSLVKLADALAIRPWDLLEATLEEAKLPDQLQVKKQRTPWKKSSHSKS